MLWRGIVLQHDETDCGAACLATIAKYYGKTVSISRIRQLSGTDKMGTSGLGIVQGAKGLGLSCKGVIVKDRNLDKSVPWPLIAHVRKDVLDHYVVIHKAGKKKLLIGDPAEGLVTMTHEQFNAVWTRVVFLLVPNEHFEQTKETKGLFGRFMYLLKPHTRTLVEVIAASLVLSLLGVASAFYFRFLIDEVLYSSMNRALTVFSMGYLLVIIFQALLNLCRSQLMMYMSNKIDASLLFEYFNHILRLPIDFFAKRKTGEILARIGDTVTVRNAISGTTLTLVIDTLMLIFGGLFLFTLGSKLIMIALVPIILSTLLAWLFMKPFKTRLKAKAVVDAEKQASFAESINGIATIKALSTEDLAFERAETRIVDSINRGMKLGSMSNIQSTLQTLFSHLGSLAIYWIGSLYILDGEMSLGQLISFVTLLGYFTGPFTRLITLQPSLQEAFVASDRLSEILDMPEETDGNPGIMKPEILNGNISVKNMSFAYGTRGYTLKNINLEIESGQKVAFVGASGSGKSTLVKLLMKFYQPAEGDISVDSVSLKDMDTESYRRLIGYVPQDILLFSGTIGENIAWGMEGTDIREILKASIAAQAHPFIEKLPDRYMTVIGEKGSSLSGGERQRIALARVLLRKPNILILDEATASLDSIAERAIMDTVYHVTEDMTAIIIAHRLSTIRHCDRIFVFANGEIVEQGDHAALLSIDGVYTQLWNAQHND
ncbi:peptidase domain-containing ABC transporter [Brucepastera parasyntrophica]|uniref:peptidase domain-containing ABC transporter n=1 Tax=Brucepastera parasyntrophica TaxID=2880008 RepID=UPI00210A2221|nr:peptidase domain-containing ABC transporter [Brucepastera parasyntrophica]ULQ60269.1 peptidase domain-containing ABC transporter [Brucepastera parasyntrophica]